MLPTPSQRRPVRIALAAFMFAATASAFPAFADTLTLSLDEALRLARERSSTLHLVAAELDAVRAEAFEAALPAQDAQLELAGGPRFGDQDDLDLELTWSRALEARGARPARKAVAAAEIGVVESEARLAELALLAEVAEVHARSLHGEARVEAAREDLVLADRLAESAQTRRELGATGRLDGILALAARGHRAAALARAEADLQRLLGRLRAALGLDPATDLRVVGDLTSLAVQIDRAAAVDETHPLITGLLAREDRAGAELDLARTRGRSRKSVHAGVGHEEDALLVFAGISWTLPAGDRGRGLVEAAVARREGLRMAREMERRRGEALVAGERAAAARLAEGVVNFEREGLAQLGESSRLVGEAYELGALPLTDVLAAARELARARSEHLDLLRDAALAALHARTLAGQEPPS